MTQDYWDKKHQKDYRNADWSSKPSIFAEQVIRYFPAKGKVLDIGTGQGNDASYFYSKGYEVVGTDFSSTAVDDAKQRVSKVTFLNIDTAEGLPFEDESFDVVYSHMALHYFDEQTTHKVFEDIYRILKPGGIFATITNTIDDQEKESRDYAKIEDEFYREKGGISKRYFSVEAMRRFTESLFETLLLDNAGTTYKDTDVSTLIRFVGKKTIVPISSKV